MKYNTIYYLERKPIESGRRKKHIFSVRMYLVGGLPYLNAKPEELFY